MGTQAVISLVKEGNTELKVVAGCNGQQAEKVAIAILQNKVLNISEIYNLSEKLGLGCKDCLVVMNGNSHIYKGEEMPLLESYREKFEDPQFNPRWKEGTTDVLFIIPVIDEIE